MNRFYLQGNDPMARKLAKICFPSYTGMKFSVETIDGGMSLVSYWSGGSRDYYAVLKLDTLECVHVPQNGTPFDSFSFHNQVMLPAPNFAVVKHCIFNGTDLGIMFYFHPENGSLMLQKPKEISQNEKIVLVATRSLKSSYAGISNYRFHEAHSEFGISLQEWNLTKQSLIENGLLTKAGAITTDGRNAVANISSLYQLKMEGK